ncbi:MAG: portal protein [Symbiopectobacterium sp.]
MQFDTIHRKWEPTYYSSIASGSQHTIHRKWEPTARDLKHLFDNNVAQKVNGASEKDPDQKIKCRHIVVPSEYYLVPSEYYQTGKKFNAPFVSIYIDVDTQHVMEETPSFDKIYCLPRWQKVKFIIFWQ